MAQQALDCRQRLATIFASQGHDVPAHHIGIWYGCDKASSNPGHYVEGTKRHGVHTLMKGMATRL